MPKKNAFCLNKSNLILKIEEKYNDNIENLLLRWYLCEGESFNDIAHKCECSKRTIIKWYNQFGFLRRPREIALTMPNYRKKQTDIMTNLWQDNEFKEKQHKGMKKKWEEEEYKQHIIKQCVNRWKNPENRKKQSDKLQETWDKPDAEKRKQKYSDVMKERQSNNNFGGSYHHIRIGKRSDLNDMFFRSSWEANWARYLNLLKQNKDIYKWEYESERFEFPVKRGIRSYTPDFKVWDNNGDIYYYEIKGQMDISSEIKFRRMNIYYPYIRIILIERKQYRVIAKKYRYLIDEWEHE